ncbi:MAG: hypothetical protein JO166_07890 [Deltaproteobacteria bacterium]|nr:hypothetical protein [Deltaproteobacteria bacterium]
MGQKIGEESSDPIVIIGSTLADWGLGLVLANCDAALFGQTVSFTGSQLNAGLNNSGWPQEPVLAPQPTWKAWHQVFDYPNISSSCDTGHYNLEVHVTRTN